MVIRNRLVAGLLLALLVTAPAATYGLARLAWWHQAGWVGVSIVPAAKKAVQMPAMLRGWAPQSVIMVMSGGPAARAGLRPGDRVESINAIPFTDAAGLRALDARLTKGDTVAYTITRDEKPLTIRAQLQSPLRRPITIAQIAVFWTVAFAYLLIGSLIFVKRPDDRRAVVFFAFTVTSAAYLFISTSAAFESGVRGIAPSTTFNAFLIAATVLVGIAFVPLMLHLALVFPSERPALRRWPKALWWIYLGPLLPLGSSAIFGLVAFQRSWLRKTDLAYANVAVAAGAAVVLLVAILTIARVALRADRGARLDAIALHPMRIIGWILAAIGATVTFCVAIEAFITAIVILVAMVVLLTLGGVAYFVAAVVSLYRSYREANVEEKRQVAWPLWAIIIAIGTRIAVGTAGFVLGALSQTSAVDAQTTMLVGEVLEIFSRGLYILIPISFAAAILKYRLMNIDIIIRKTVVYAILSTIIVLFYLGLVGGLGTLLVQIAGIQNQTFVIAATLVVALLFVPLRNKLQTLVDRNLFRHRYDYAEAMTAITAETRAASDATVLLASCSEQLQQALQNRAIVSFLDRQGEYVATAKVGVSDALLGRLRVPQSFVEALDRPFDPRKRKLGEDARTTLEKIDAVLVVPLGTRGFIAASPKLNGRDFDVEDIDFLGNAAETIGGGIDRIRMLGEEADYAQARAIQQTLLPRAMPSIPLLEVKGLWQPARTMGGDYYDVIQLGPDEVAICIGDVAGKGMPAALLMSGLQAAVRASASSSPRDLCERVRRVVVSSLSGGRFVTFFYAVVNTRSMSLRWCNAGHNAPMLMRAGGDIVRLDSGGPAISRLFQPTPYGESEISLVAGDRLVLFTDGVTEARNPAGDLMGDERLEALLRVRRSETAPALVSAVAEAASVFSAGELEDDLTVVVAAVS